MKKIIQYISESSSTTTIINKIKKEFKNWGTSVSLVSSKHKLYSSYYVYVYDIANESELRKVDDIIKKYVPEYNGMPDDKLAKKFKEIKEIANKHKNAEGVMKYLYDIPCIFIGFTSQDLK